MKEDNSVKTLAIIAAAASTLALVGCMHPDVAEQHAQDLAAQQCAQQGQAYQPTSGSAVVTPGATAATANGQCVDPNAPPPPAPPPSGG